MNPWTTISANELTPKHAGQHIRFRPYSDDAETVVQARIKDIAGPFDGAVHVSVEGVPSPRSFDGRWSLPGGANVDVKSSEGGES